MEFVSTEAVFPMELLCRRNVIFASFGTENQYTFSHFLSNIENTIEKMM